MTDRELLGQFAGVAPWALLVGIGYALLVHWLEEKGHAEGYTWLEVVVGVALTVAFAVPVVGWPAALAVLGLFVITGTPMIAATVWRYAQARAAYRRALAEAMNGNTPEALTEGGGERGAGSGGAFAEGAAHSAPTE